MGTNQDKVSTATRCLSVYGRDIRTVGLVAPNHSMLIIKRVTKDSIYVTQRRNIEVLQNSIGSEEWHISLGVLLSSKLADVIG